MFQVFREYIQYIPQGRYQKCFLWCVPSNLSLFLGLHHWFCSGTEKGAEHHSTTGPFKHQFSKCSTWRRTSLSLNVSSRGHQLGPTQPTFRASMSKCKAWQSDMLCGAMLKINRLLFGPCVHVYVYTYCIVWIYIYNEIYIIHIS